MRIKRFVAPDMRTALRMVRDEQGPDAVILSNRPVADGIEVVAATDYDEALVQQALRSAAPGLGELAAPASMRAAPTPAPAMRRDAADAQGSRADAMIAAMSGAPVPVRDSLAARARAAFRSETADAPAPTPAAPRKPVTLAQQAAARAALFEREADELTPQAFAEAARPTAPAPALNPGAEFRELLARLTAAEDAQADAVATAATPAAPTPIVSPAQQAAAAVVSAEPVAPAPAPALVAVEMPAPVAAPAPVTPVTAIEPVAAPAVEIPAPVAVAAPVVPIAAVPAEDPSLVAMRAELAAMRELMERQLDQLAIERLRGSVGRARVFDTLVACGCDEGVAQSVASRIDARLSPEETREPMLAELSRMIMTLRAEPIDEGGVIALVGPTGAGKTTTIAKLAARFAARHRARDVALVTTDIERAGAREQLHAHGRRLGITVCEAEGPEALNATLEQLADYPLVLVDTAGYAARDRALLGQILWLRTARRVRSLLVLPANAHPHDLGETIRRYRPASPEGVVLTKTDETGRLGAALSVLVKQDMPLAYTTSGQAVPADIETADPARLVAALEKLRRAADSPLHAEDRHAVA
jgi:flagellar biosynthesis protein FlhF